MVRLFLVEDEILARNNIHNTIDWASNGIEFVGEAPDGEIALPRILDLRPDILLTDIKMPFMDGLELSRHVKQQLPATKILILSGHDEFEYAQQAIEIGVNAYILKPLTSADVLGAVLKVRDELLCERKASEALYNQQNETDITQRRLFISGLLGGYLRSWEILERAQKAGVVLRGGCYMAVALRFQPPEQAPEVFVLPGSWGEAPYFKLSDDEAMVIVQGQELEGLEALASRASESLGPLVQARCGSVVSRLTDIAKSCFVARSTPRASLDADSRRTLLDSMRAIPRDRMLQFLRTAGADEARAFWGAALLETGADMSIFMCRCHLYTELFLTCLQFSREIDVEVPLLREQSFMLEKIVMQNESAENFVDMACDISTWLISLRRESGAKLSTLISRARKYIEEHFRDETLSLNTVAASVNVSPPYLSASFKEQCGENFSEFVTTLRIQEAKRLLRAGDLRTSEIAYQVGYKNPNYFSMVFKKVTGQAPGEYKSGGWA